MELHVKRILLFMKSLRTIRVTRTMSGNATAPDSCDLEVGSESSI